jgi:hypothetical protein
MHGRAHCLLAMQILSNSIDQTSNHDVFIILTNLKRFPHCVVQILTQASNLVFQLYSKDMSRR